MANVSETGWYIFQLLLLYALLLLKIVDFYCTCVMRCLMHSLYILLYYYRVLSLWQFNMLLFYLSWSCVATNGIITSTIRFVLVLYSSLILYLYLHLHCNTLSRPCVEFLTTCNNTRIGHTCLLETYTNKLGSVITNENRVRLLTVAKVTIDTDWWKVCNRSVYWHWHVITWVCMDT